MGKKYKFIPLGLLVFVVVAGLSWFLTSHDVAVLNPKGLIANEQYKLLVISTLLMLLIVVPVFVLTFTIAWKYRASNKKAKYTPDWDHNRILETLWWGFPLAIISILAVLAFTSSHQLDPFRPLASDAKPITIQVVALQWKWLFIYPEQDIASVNYIQFPEQTPIDFEITADAPMNSFWIPKLGGQVYAMAGMKTKLHLMANEQGSYRGSSANISGKGFAGMNFTATSSSREDFDRWVASVKSSGQVLTTDVYTELAKPSEANPATVYASRDEKLYDTVIRKYMAPTLKSEETEHH